jgi:hypothetical protein
MFRFAQHDKQRGQSSTESLGGQLILRESDRYYTLKWLAGF